MSSPDQLQALLSDIRSCPEDIQRRIRLADFLDEQNDPRGEWIRLRCADDFQPDRPRMENWVAQFSQFDLDDNDRREAELLEIYGDQWLGVLPQGIQVVPRRGLLEVCLPEEISLNLETLANWLRRQQPWIETLFLTVYEEQEFQFLIEQRLLDQIVDLRLYVNCELSSSAFEHLAELRQLRSLLLNGDAFTDESFQYVSQLRSLQSLELLGCSKFRGTGLSALSVLPELRHLTILPGEKFSDFSGFAGLKHLEKLTIRSRFLIGEHSISDKICEAIRGLGSLKVLSIVESTETEGATNIGLRALRDLTQLESLTLEVAEEADLGQLVVLSRLQELNLCGQGATDYQLERVALLKSLCRILISSTQITGTGVPQLSSLAQLELLELPPLRVLSPQMQRFVGQRVPARLKWIGNDAADKHLPALSQLSQLTELDLSNSSADGPGLKFLCDLPCLESLSVNLDQLHGLQPEIVQKWTALKRLSVRAFGRSSASFKPLSYFRPLCNLSISLELNCRKFDEMELAFLADLRQMKLLAISNSESISNKGLKFLQELTKLQQLILGESEITEDGLQFLTDMTDMRELHLSDIPLQGDGLRFLRGMTKLISLQLNHTGVTDTGMPFLATLSQLEDLDLYRSKITDRGLSELTALRRLKCLNLSHSNVTDSGVLHLSKMRQLRHLWIDQTEITDSGYATLQQALPQCCFRYSPSDGD